MYISKEQEKELTPDQTIVFVKLFNGALPDIHTVFCYLKKNNLVTDEIEGDLQNNLNELWEILKNHL